MWICIFVKEIFHLWHHSHVILVYVTTKEALKTIQTFSLPIHGLLWYYIETSKFDIIILLQPFKESPKSQIFVQIWVSSRTFLKVSISAKWSKYNSTEDFWHWHCLLHQIYFWDILLYLRLWCDRISDDFSPNRQGNSKN